MYRSHPRLGGTLIKAVPLKKAVLLGYWPNPDQSAPDRARHQFEEEAQQRLQTIADRFTDQGVEVQTELVFTKDRDQLIDTATNKYECQSVLIPGTLTGTCRIGRVENSAIRHI